MASTSRKKQDEKNLKTLRELGSLPQNKYCFDCNQRGPTYVNVTIGSFVCTKCSGMLRGITPPHRVKSISMATFTNEEIELLKNRGNDYCRGVWLGLYENTNLPTDFRDEQTIRDFMVDKYEKKRYHLDPAQALKNGYNNNNNHNNNIKIKPLTKLVSDPKPVILNGNNNNINHNILDSSSRKRPEYNKKINNVLINNEFNVNFEKADIFSASNHNSSINGSGGGGGGDSGGLATTAQPSFANFDDNPVFNNASNTSMPGGETFSGGNFNQTMINQGLATLPQQPPPPTQDKYAALKDLDNALKSHNGCLDWNSSGSTGSLYSSSTPNGSMYSSPSPQSSMFGSPSQGQFMNAFPPNPDSNSGFSNPFNTGSSNGLNWPNTTTNGFSNVQQQQQYANPFRDPVNNNNNNKMNGFTQNFQPAVFPVANGATSWGVNPFKVGGATSNNSNNPFL